LSTSATLGGGTCLLTASRAATPLPRSRCPTVIRCASHCNATCVAFQFFTVQGSLPPVLRPQTPYVQGTANFEGVFSAELDDEGRTGRRIQRSGFAGISSEARPCLRAAQLASTPRASAHSSSAGSAWRCELKCSASNIAKLGSRGAGGRLPGPGGARRAGAARARRRAQVPRQPSHRQLGRGRQVARRLAGVPVCAVRAPLPCGACGPVAGERASAAEGAARAGSRGGSDRSRLLACAVHAGQWPKQVLRD